MLRAASAAALALILAQPACASDQPPTAVTEHGKVRIVTVAEGLEHPWGVAFLPDGRALVTERPGRLRIVGADGKLGVPLEGVPAVSATGQGGLLDVQLDPDFAKNRLVYLSSAEPATPRPAASTLCWEGGRRLVDWSPRAEPVVAEAVRGLLGRDPASLSDEQALELALNPSLNRYRLETLQLLVHSPLGRALHHPSYTFLKRLSHTADSQDQRHRMVPASRPLMTLTDTERPDFVLPPLAAENAQARDLFERAMQRAWEAKNRLLDLGVPLESALYLLPNAKALRIWPNRPLAPDPEASGVDQDPGWKG